MHITDDDALALIERSVSAADRTRIDAHLDGCDACRELVAAMAMTASTSASVMESEIPSISLADSSGLDSLITPFADLDDSLPTQIYASKPPSAEGSPLEEGDLVGHFRIMRALGRGAMGEVYLARDTMLGRKVALKVIAADLLGSERAMRRFLFEAKATARFNHPNIVTIHAVGEHGDRPFVALEYVEGENLRERTKKEPLALPEALRIGLAIAEALSEAHAAGILHRDLKPANVIIGADGRVRLLDFGLAKAVQAIDEDEPARTSSSSSTWLVGTPRYMAPEQWRGGKVEGTTDVFALGVILFELCTGGVRPFDAKNTVELLRVVTADEAAPELKKLCDVPEDLSRLVSRCLDKEASKRPTASEMADALRDLMQPKRPLVSVAEGPFRGLLPFTERNASVFFGRDREIAALLERLRIQPVLPVLGPPGSGKTSLIQAGVIPWLRDLGDWVVLSLRPGPRPFEILASRLERRDSGVFVFGADKSGRSPSMLDVDARAEVLRGAPRRLSVMLRELADAEDAKVLLFVDQLEEVFTMVDEAEQKSFLEAVCTAADDVDEPVRVVLSLRHDFVDRLSTEGELGRAMSRFIVLKNPDGDTLRQILEEPVKRVGYRFEDDRLVDQMVAAVQGEPSCLPLLQFAASQLWDQRDEEEQVLLRSAYEAMGGVGGALARHADSLLDALPSDQRTIARTLLLRLVTSERTRRIIPRSQALDGLGADATHVLKHLTESRLIAVSKLRRGSDPMLELAHQSLIHTWKTLADWIEHSADELRILGEATEAAELWNKRGRRAAELWDSDALSDVDRALQRSTTEVPELVALFVEASRRQQRRRDARGRMRFLGAVAAAMLVVVSVVIAFVWISRSRREAELARQEALQHEKQAREQQSRLLVQGARKALQEGYPLEARAQVRRALELGDSAAARALWQRLRTDPTVMRRRFGIVNYGVAVSPDGQTLAVASHDGRVYLVNTGTGAHRHLDGHADAVSAAAFTADGKGLVSSDLDGNVVYWEIATETARSLRRLGKGNVWGLAMSEDDRYVAAAGQVGLRVLDMRTGDVRIAPSNEPERAVVYAGRGKLLVAGGAAGMVRVFDARTATVLRAVAIGHAIENIAASPGDADRVAVSDETGGVTVITVADGKVERRLQHTARVRALAFHPSGSRVAAAGVDGTVSVFDLSSGAEVAHYRAEHRLLGAAFLGGGDRLALVGDHELLVMAPGVARRPHTRGHDGVVRDVRMSADGKWVVSAGYDSTVRVWDVQSGEVQHVLRGHAGAVGRVDISADGTALASAGVDGTVRIWDPVGGKLRRVLGGHEGPVHAVSFNADGSALASGGHDRTARIWRVSTGAQQRVLRGHEQAVTDVMFSPKGDVLATGSADATLRLWPSVGIESVLRGHEGAVATVAFDADGELLASAGADKTVRVWSLEPGKRPATVDERPGRVQRVAFEPSGARLGIARSNGGLELFHLATNKRVNLAGHHGTVNALHFDRRGELVASAGDDGTVRVWQVATGRSKWRGVALVPEGPHALTHRGWRKLASAGSTMADAKWVRHVATSAQSAAQALPGSPVCLLTHEGAFEMWDVAGAEPVHTFTSAIEDLVALPSGCVARSVGAVHFITQSGARRELDVGGAPHAIGWGEQRLLVATDNEVVAFTESGERIARHAHDVGAVTAVTQIGSQLIIGHAKRNVTLIGTSEDEPPSVARFERATQAAPTKMTAGPRSTLIVGYRDGTVALFDTVDGALLNLTRLHGAVSHLLAVEDKLFAVTELGDTLTWELGYLTREYCELLNTVWQRVPVVWAQGETTLREAPVGHACK